MTISAPLALVSKNSPLEFVDAIISPIDALLIAVIVSASSVTLEKFMALPTQQCCLLRCRCPRCHAIFMGKAKGMRQGQGCHPSMTLMVMA